jgi:DNA-binding Lrp family transcriptional regulator
MPIEEMKRNERSFVLINVEPGREEKVMNELLKFDEVREAHEITGEKDIIVVLETERDMVAPGSEKIVNFVTHKIAKIHGVRGTDTIIPTTSKIKT